MFVKAIVKSMSRRPHRVVQEEVTTTTTTTDTTDTGDGYDAGGGLSESSWSKIPHEIMRAILVKVEESESSWPSRKSVVALAGVCRSWRTLIKEIVPSPEASGKLTFPISLKQPGPRDSLLQCFVKRDRSRQIYRLYFSSAKALANDGKFLMAAQRCKYTACPEYIISLHADKISKSNCGYIGKLRANFIATEFTIHDRNTSFAGANRKKGHLHGLPSLKQLPPEAPVGNYPVAHVEYLYNVNGTISRGPRKMRCTMNTIPATAMDSAKVAPLPTKSCPSNTGTSTACPISKTKSHHMDSLHSGSLPSEEDGVLVLNTKSPRWHQQLRCWCLNFHGRVTVASVKNFQLVSDVDSEEVILQFGKVGKDLFTMDYRYPISAFQAFAICLTSFETKIACE